MNSCLRLELLAQPIRPSTRSEYSVRLRLSEYSDGLLGPADSGLAGIPQVLGLGYADANVSA